MLSFFRNLDWSVFDQMLLRAVPALICVTLHEIAHGYVAYKMGDDTAKNMGRLSLNPIRHIDPFGLLSMLLLGFGWAKAVPVNMNNFDNPKKGMAITALAGPLMNIIISVVSLVLYGIIGGLFYSSEFAGKILVFLATTGYMSCAFAIFNLLPIPPLDGSKILFSFLPDDKYYMLMQYERYGMAVLMVIVVTGFINSVLFTLTDGLYTVLTPIATTIMRLLFKLAH